MANLNTAQVMGYLGNDADVQSLQTGDTKYSFSIATSDKWKDRMTGEPRSLTEWHRVETIVKSTASANIHTFYKDILKKGKSIFVQGKLRSSKYQLDGIDRIKHYIEVNRMAGGDIQPLEKKPQTQMANQNQNQSSVDESYSEPPFE
jgi:single-strand DNA-binding protein